MRIIDGCPKGEECVRHLSSQYIPDEKTVGLAVFPSALKAGSCSHFKEIRKIHAAYGFDKIFQEVKRKDDTPLRDKIKAYLGSHTEYYRYHNGKKLLTPEQQQWIISLFRRYGYTENLVFDHYRDVYDLS